MQPVTRLTAQEFERRVAELQKGSTWKAVFFISVFFGGILAAFPIANLFGDLAGWIVLGATIASPWSAFPLIGLHLQRRVGLLCPSCGRWLYGMGQTIILSGRCRFCKTQVLDGPDAE
jgi:hypothetical protein